MPQRHFTPSATLLNDLSHILEAQGFEPADFMITQEAGAELSDEFGEADHLLTVQRRSTRDERNYVVSPGMPWLFSAFADLTAGHFGPPTSRTH